MSRADEIMAAAHPAPRKLTDRDKAYVLAIYRTFGADRFWLTSLAHSEFPREIAQRFNVASYRFDDRAVLGKRLPSHGLIEVLDGARAFRLTPRGAQLAKELESA